MKYHRHTKVSKQSLIDDSLMSNKVNDDSQVVQLETIKMFETGFKTFFPKDHQEEGYS